MKEPTVDEIRRAFGRHGVEAPGEYIWMVEHHLLGWEASSQFEPWHLCAVDEILPLSKRWPAAGISRELIPFARDQRGDDLACFEFDNGKLVRVCHVHYDLSPPVYVETSAEYPTFWDWLHAALEDVRTWFEICDGDKDKLLPNE